LVGDFYKHLQKKNDTTELTTTLYSVHEPAGFTIPDAMIGNT
jgi:hypothetical protein